MLFIDIYTKKENALIGILFKTFYSELIKKELVQ